MLACARIGAPHTVVFGGFAADALRDRINDCQAKVVLTQDGGLAPRQRRPAQGDGRQGARGHARASRRCSCSATSGQEKAPIDDEAGSRPRLVRSASADATPRRTAQPEIVDAEHPLFILYTSGSTGKPKGVCTRPRATSPARTSRPSTSSICATTTSTGAPPTSAGSPGTATSCTARSRTARPACCTKARRIFPDWGRFWRIIENHKVTILYTAPTAIRAFIRQGNEWPEKSDLSSLRLLGSVGEPINPEAWIWYYANVGTKRCPIVDTWWQTETGAIMLTTLPGVHTMKPGSTGLPFFGVEPAVVTEDGTDVRAGQGGLLVLRRPWPSMLRTIWGDDERYQQAVLQRHPGLVLHGRRRAPRREDGYFRVVGRIDDVLNVAGHRIGTAEIESALVAHPAVAEAAAVGRPDDLKGQALVVFVTLKPGHAPDAAMKQALAEHVAKEIGKFARPDDIRFADGLPKTRSGKIMRRLLEGRRRRARSARRHLDARGLHRPRKASRRRIANGHGQDPMVSPAFSR